MKFAALLLYKSGICIIFYRGESFLCEVSRLSEVIPEHVNVMASTATATISSRLEVVKSLDMQIQ